MHDQINSGTSPPTVGEGTATTHERLLAAAAVLFAERGYGGTSMADIAEQVGVRKASLYNYYPSKEEILMHLLRGSIRAWGEASGGELEGDGPIGERLWRHLLAAVRFVGEHPEMVAIFRVAATQIGGELGERAMAEVQSFKLSHQRQLEKVFTRAIADGAVRPGKAADHAFVLRTFANGVVGNQLRVCEGDERMSERRLRRVWELFWSGLAAEGSEERA